jgi:hypothetical protein
MSEAHKLRELAAWYREFAERAGNPWIWEARLRRAEELDEEAARLETRAAQSEGSASSPRRQRERTTA